ncbi:unnamed protein product [Haemonchus placei]|uniref:Reverse transcriptase domain-containing protein n=1 Tax=Haemonchus placei TaxID=6290 RepID=A0A0N4W5C1_HAEPC|nr:unnamed protein product [Haemonchus placei]
MATSTWDPSLVRFRIGDLAVASDIEKAFLQVRLQLKDRDATRFLWMKDVNQPVIRDNLITYPFNRVTFGLICSPFLLARTIKYHLKHNSKNPGISHEILNNTYSSVQKSSVKCIDAFSFITFFLVNQIARNLDMFY